MKVKTLSNTGCVGIIAISRRAISFDKEVSESVRASSPLHTIRLTILTDNQGRRENLEAPGQKRI